MLQFTNPIVAGVTLVRPAIQSPNYDPVNLTGWAINQDGSAFFHDLITTGGTDLDYSPTAAAGNLIRSSSRTAGTDQFGNAYLAGDVSYAYTVGRTAVLALQITGGSLSVWQAATEAGPYSQVSTINFDTGGNTNIPGPLKLGGGRVILPPSNDNTGATDGQAIMSWLASGYAVELLAGTYYTSVLIRYPGGASLKGPGFQSCTIQAVGAMSAVLASTGWDTNANTTSQSPVTMEGFAVQASGTATYGIVSQNFWSYFTRLEIKNATADGLRFDYQCANATTSFGTSVTAVENHVTECQFRLNGAAGLRVHDDPTHPHFTDGWVTDGVFQGPGATSTAPLLQIDAMAGWKVHGGHLYGAGGTAMSGQRPFNTRITGVYVEPWGTSTTAGTYAAIGIDGIADGGLGPSLIAGCNVVLNNTTPGNVASTIDGISVRAASGGSGWITIGPNTIGNPETPSATYRGAIVLQAQSATATLNAVTVGNQPGSGWNTTVDIITNGGVVNHTAGV